MLIVQKYGGTSLADADKILNAARRAVSLAQQGHRIVMVVSAQGHTTDEMIRQAMDINRRGNPREMDTLLSAGEQISAALMAMAIGALGYPAISLTGWQAGIETDDIHGNAHILTIDTGRIHKELKQGKIIVAAGFQGIDSENNITTLGRGGSDTTAVALAAFLKADKCQIFTDVDGVYNRDPRLYSDAIRFTRISYDHMLTLIENGAQVLHDRSVQFAKEYNIPVEVLSAFTGTPGTIVCDSESL